MEHKLKHYRITDKHGTVHDVAAHWMFNNNGELVFRVKEEGYTAVIGLFAVGTWSSCVRVMEEAPLQPMEGIDQ